MVYSESQGFSDRFIVPYLLSTFNLLTVDAPAIASLSLTVGVVDALAPVQKPAVIRAPRPTRCRKSTAKVTP